MKTDTPIKDAAPAAEVNETERVIQALGGPAVVARKLNFNPKNGTQRVYNWIARDRIPAQVRLDHPELFQRSAGNRGQRAGSASAKQPV